MKYWIKRRNNPQTGTYYTLYGKLPYREAMRMERTLYGDNTMLCFETIEAYNAKIVELHKSGERVLS